MLAAEVAASALAATAALVDVVLMVRWVRIAEGEVRVHRLVWGFTVPVVVVMLWFRLPWPLVIYSTLAFLCAVAFVLWLPCRTGIGRDP